MGRRDLELRVCNPNEKIFNSFKYSGISRSSDGSEDDIFWSYKDLEKRNYKIWEWTRIRSRGWVYN